MSSCTPNTTFKNVSSIGGDFLLNTLENNLKTFLDWSFLNIGAWFDVQRSNQNLYGGRYHFKLSPVDDPSYQNGQVWQTSRKDWVWENNISYESSSPISISGVYINGTLATSGYIANYPMGQIVFDSPKKASTNVELNYSYRFIQTYRANDAPWFNLLQFSSFNTDNKDISQNDEGEWSIGSYKRIQMPCVIIEAIPRSRSMPYELGSGGLIFEQDIILYVLAENKNDRNKILDIFRYQQDSVIYLYNTNEIAKNDHYPLDYNGNLKNNALMYPDLVETYKWRKCWFKSVTLNELSTPHPNLHIGAARLTAEIIYP
jgi:hypothetical protein